MSGCECRRWALVRGVGWVCQACGLIDSGDVGKVSPEGVAAMRRARLLGAHCVAARAGRG